MYSLHYLIMNMIFGRYYAIIGYYYDKVKNYNKMKINYARAIEFGDKIAVNNLYLFYRRNKDQDNMIKVLEQGVKLNDRESMFRLGLYYRKIKDYDNMKKFYSMAIELGCTSSMHNLANYHQDVENNQYVALQYYQNAIKTKPKHYNKSMHAMGNCYSKLENWDLMKEHYAVAIESGYVPAIISMTSYYYYLGNYDDAMKYCLMGVGLKNPIIMCYLGLCYGKLEDYNNAKKYCLMSMECGFDDAMNELGVLYYNNKDYDNAKKCYLMQIESSKGDYDLVKYNLNLCLKDVGDIEEMIKYRVHLNKENLHLMNGYYAMLCQGQDKCSFDHKIKKCIICFEKKCMIKLYCNHMVCCSCYSKLYLCPMCRDSFE